MYDFFSPESRLFLVVTIFVVAIFILDFVVSMKAAIAKRRRTKSYFKWQLAENICDALLGTAFAFNGINSWPNVIGVVACLLIGGILIWDAYVGMKILAEARKSPAGYYS